MIEDLEESNQHKICGLEDENLFMIAPITGFIIIQITLILLTYYLN